MGIVDGAQNRLAARGPSCPNGSTVTGTRRYGFSSMAFGDVDCSDAGLGLSHELSVLIFLMVTGHRLGLLDRPWSEHFEEWRLEALEL